MEFRTTVDLPPRCITLDISGTALLLGSCFAEHIGDHLADALPAGQVCVNPFGVLYNPLSIAQALDVLLDGRLPESSTLFQGRDGLWHSWLHSGAFSAATKDDCARKTSERFETAMQTLSHTELIVLTMGTAHAYRRVDSGQIVANCHKEPQKSFTVTRIGINEATTALDTVFKKLHEHAPSAKVVLTVSPYRYVKLGMHGSTLDKAILHLTSEQLERQYAFVHYFPAFELVTDELRDYRFYDRDMLHPSEQAIDYVWERFRDWCFSPRLQDFADDKAALLRLERHRPLHEEGAAYAAFRCHTAQLRHKLLKKWGDLIAPAPKGTEIL